MEELTQFELRISLVNQGGETLARYTRQLQGELQELGVEAKLMLDDSSPLGTKSIDPVILGALIVSVGPTILTKFLDFLHAWAMRREGSVVKIRVQTKKGSALEIEVPASMSRDEAKNWIEMVGMNLLSK